MGQHQFAVSALLGLALAVSACGAANEGEEAKSPDSVDSDEPPRQSPMEELQAIPRDLRAQVANLTKPIDDVQKVIDQLSSIPKRYGLDPADMIAMAKATVESGKVNVNVKAEVSADARAEIETALKTLKGIIAALKATPDRVAALVSKIASLSAKVPGLAAKVTVSAGADAVNPFAGAGAKAKAQADVQKVKQVAADVMKVVTDTQAKIVGIPAAATAALSKLMAALKGGDGAGSDSDDVASGEETDAASAPSAAGAEVTPPTPAARKGAASPVVIDDGLGVRPPIAAPPKATLVQAPAATDQVVFRDGTMIRGRVVKQTPGTFVTIETADGAQHTIPWDRVKEVVVAPLAKTK
jgi:prefoldin subunit 5